MRGLFFKKNLCVLFDRVFFTFLSSQGYICSFKINILHVGSSNYSFPYWCRYTWSMMSLNPIFFLKGAGLFNASDNFWLMVLEQLSIFVWKNKFQFFIKILRIKVFVISVGTSCDMFLPNAVFNTVIAVYHNFRIRKILLSYVKMIVH